MHGLLAQFFRPMPKIYFSKLEAPTKAAESLSIEEVRTLDGFEGLKAAWNDLVRRGGSYPLSSNFAFALYWWKWRNYGNQLFVLLARDGLAVSGSLGHSSTSAAMFSFPSLAVLPCVAMSRMGQEATNHLFSLAVTMGRDICKAMRIEPILGYERIRDPRLGGPRLRAGSGRRARKEGVKLIFVDESEAVAVEALRQLALVRP